MTRWSAAVGGAALGLLVLLAVPVVGHPIEPAPTIEPTAAAAPTARFDADARFDAEAAYTAQVQDRGMQVANMPSESLTRLGWALCDGLRRRPEPAVSAAPATGITAYDTRIVIDAATRHLCRDQRGKVRAYLKEGR